MTAVAPLPPVAIKAALESKGYHLIAADDHNWAFSLGDDEAPIIVPHKVDRVPVVIAQHIAGAVGLETYLKHFDPAAEPFPADPPG